MTFLFAVLKTFIVRINYLLTKKDKWVTLERKNSTINPEPHDQA